MSSKITSSVLLSLGLLMLSLVVVANAAQESEGKPATAADVKAVKEPEPVASNLQSTTVHSGGAKNEGVDNDQEEFEEDFDEDDDDLLDMAGREADMDDEEDFDFDDEDLDISGHEVIEEKATNEVAQAKIEATVKTVEAPPSGANSVAGKSAADSAKTSEKKGL